MSSSVMGDDSGPFHGRGKGGGQSRGSEGHNRMHEENIHLGYMTLRSICLMR